MMYDALKKNLTRGALTVAGLTALFAGHKYLGYRNTAAPLVAVADDTHCPAHLAALIAQLDKEKSLNNRKAADACEWQIYYRTLCDIATHKLPEPFIADLKSALAKQQPLLLSEKSNLHQTLRNHTDLVDFLVKEKAPALATNSLDERSTRISKEIIDGHFETQRNNSLALFLAFFEEGKATLNPENPGKFTIEFPKKAPFKDEDIIELVQEELK